MKKQTLLTLAIVFLSISIFAQGVVNDGAVINITSGTHFIISNGNYLNQTNSTDGRLDLDGYLYVDGNFTNNASNNVFINRDTDGEVVFNGSGTQTISTNAADMSNFIDFEKVSINAGSSTELAAGSAATTNGILTVNGVFTLKTPLDENPGGSLITGTGAGSVTGTGDITVERFFKVNGRWQYVSSPIIGQQSSIFTDGFGADFNPNFYTYNETYDEPVDPTDILYSNYDYGNGYGFWQAWEQVQANAGSPVNINVASGTKTGYICYNNQDLNAAFTSTTPSDINNEASYSPTVSFNSNDGNGDFYDGWSLIGNPYPCALNWDEATWTKTNITNTVYMWDGDNGNYIYYNNGLPDDFVQGTGQTLNSDANARYIPAMQSFFIKATAAPTFTIPAAARTHNSNMMYKNNSTYQEFSYVKLQVQYSGKTDETIVRFFDDATTGFDDNFDAYKMYSNTTALPQIYSVIYSGQEMPVAFNSLPIESISDETIIPLGILAKESGSYTITATELNDLDFKGEIYLYDVNPDNGGITNEVYSQNLTINPEYTVQLEEGEIRDRLFLKFVKSGQTNINDNYFNVDIWSNNSDIIIKIDSYDMISSVATIYDITGKVIKTKHLNGSYNIINMPTSTGSYFIKLVIKNGKVYNDKVILKR